MPVNVEIDGNEAYDQLMKDLSTLFSNTKEPKTLQTSIYNRTSNFEINPYWSCLGSTKCFVVPNFPQDMDITIQPPNPEIPQNGEVEVCAYEGSTRIVTGNAFFIEINDGSDDALARELMLFEIYALVSKNEGGETIFAKATPIYGSLLTIPGFLPLWEPWQTYPPNYPKGWLTSYASLMLQQSVRQSRLEGFVSSCYDTLDPSLTAISSADTSGGQRFNIAAEMSGKNQCIVDVYIWDGDSPTPPRPIIPD